MTSYVTSLAPRQTRGYISIRSTVYSPRAAETGAASRAGEGAGKLGVQTWRCSHLLPNLQPLNSLRSQRHTRHLQPFHHPVPQVLLGRAVLPSSLRSQHQLRHHT